MNAKFQAQISELEERLRRAMFRSEADVLDELIAPDLIFTNHLGQLVTKQEDLALHRSGYCDRKHLNPRSSAFSSAPDSPLFRF